jgi:hypothetical protein
MRPPFRIASLRNYADISWKSAKQKSFGFHKSAIIFIASGNRPACVAVADTTHFARQHGVATVA